MNIKASVIHQIKACRSAVIIFYSILAGIIILGSILNLCFGGNVSGSIGGMETCTLIFMFILGLNSFRENFYLAMQTGTSRKCLFISRLISVAIVSFALALFDKVIFGLNCLSSQITGSGTAVSTLFMETYQLSPASDGIVWFLADTLYSFSTILVAAAVGYLLTCMFYRFNKVGRICLTVGLPVFVLIVLPIMLGVFMFTQTSGTLSFLIKIVDFFGFCYSTWFGATLTGIVEALLLGGLSWLFIRKAEIQKQ